MEEIILENPVVRGHSCVIRRNTWFFSWWHWVIRKTFDFVLQMLFRMQNHTHYFWKISFKNTYQNVSCLNMHCWDSLLRGTSFLIHSPGSMGLFFLSEIIQIVMTEFPHLLIYTNSQHFSILASSWYFDKISSSFYSLSFVCSICPVLLCLSWWTDRR